MCPGSHSVSDHGRVNIVGDSSQPVVTRQVAMPGAVGIRKGGME